MDMLALNQANRRAKLEENSDRLTPKKSLLVEDDSTGWIYVLTISDGAIKIKQQNGLTTLLLDRAPSGTIYTGDNSQISVQALTASSDNITLDPETIIQYSSEDMSIATVSVDGLIEGIGSGSTSIVVSVTYRNITLQENVPLLVLHLSKLNDKVIEAQAAYDFALEGTNHGYYPVGSKRVLLDAINNAQAVINNHTTQLEIDNAMNDLSNALINFQSLSIVVDTTMLSESINEAITLRDEAVVGSGYGEYSQESIDLLDLNISTAQSILNTYQDRNQAAIDTATSEMNEAKAQFLSSITPTVDMTNLLAAIDSARVLHDGAVEGVMYGEYLVGSKSDLLAAITRAQNVSDSTAHTAQEVAAEEEALANAVNIFEMHAVPALLDQVKIDSTTSFSELLGVETFGNINEDITWDDVFAAYTMPTIIDGIEVKSTTTFDELSGTKTFESISNWIEWENSAE